MNEVLASIPAILNSTVQVILVLTIPLVIYSGFKNRNGNTNNNSKGIGWQFIRFNVLCVSFPLTGILALNGVLSGETAAAIIASGMGYAFAKIEKQSTTTDK